MSEQVSKSNQEKGNWFGRHKVLTVILGLMVLGFIVMGVSGTGNTTTNTNNGGNKNTTTPEAKKAEPEKKKLSIDEVYGKINTGMTEAEVDAIVTSKPINCTESEMQGLGTSKFCTYGNVFTEGTSIMVTYNNGKVFTKTKTQY